MAAYSREGELTPYVYEFAAGGRKKNPARGVGGQELALTAGGNWVRLKLLE